MSISTEVLKQVLVEQRQGILRKDPGIIRSLLAQIDSKIKDLNRMSDA